MKKILSVKLIRNIGMLSAFILLLLSGFGGSDAFSDATREVILDKIDINGTAIDMDFVDEIVLSNKDSISFHYHCAVRNADKTPFLFRLVFSNSSDSSVSSINTTVVSFKELGEDTYTLSILAFDLMRNWETKPLKLQFRVNNRESELLRSIQLLRQKNYNDSLSALSKFTPAKGGLSIGSLIASIMATTLISVALTYLIMRKRTIKTNNNLKNKELEDNMATIITSESPNNKKDVLFKENSNLKSEIEALRGQIDRLEMRGRELKKQNKELEEHIIKLSRSKDEIVDLQKQKDELFAVIIHDIKNPAALIKSLVELLRSYDLTATEQQEIIDDIFATTTRIVALSQEVSRILALEGTSLHLDVEPTQIGEIIRDVFRRNAIAGDRKNIKMEIEIPSDLPEAEVDPQKIDEVIENLVSNAVKFTQKGGRVGIKAKKSDNCILVEVSDNGLGLSQDDVKNAFKRGSRLSAKPTAGESSTGLGLWIVKKLVEAHSGKVEVRSAVGKGATFTVYLPLKYTSKD